MSNAELWDLDTSGGIMEQIRELVAPPPSTDALRRSRRKRERNVYQRPARAVNHESCDSCKEGGDLMCCDKCPAAFHLLCHDPPLEEDDVPAGEWLCHKCRSGTLETQKDDDAESNSSKSSIRSGRGKRSATSIEADGEPEHPLRTLVKAAKLMNPVQFDVGKEISCTKPLPGSSKRIYGKSAKNGSKKQAHELDNGMVPLPAKVCFSCNKSCRVAPLVQCDYCPLLFHLDCLDPPLTGLPQGRWMCPNHVEHILDSCLLKSQSLTERMRLWDRYSGLVDSHTVKVDFLNKTHRKNPMFRFKRKLSSRLTVEVPEAIKNFYNHPAELLPEPLRGPPPATSAHDLPGTRGTYAATFDEQEEWLTSVVSMQSSVAKFMAKRQLQKTFRGADSLNAVQKPTASVAPVVQKDSESSLAHLSPMSCDNLSDSSKSSTSSSSTTTAIEFPDCDSKFFQNSNTLYGEDKSNNLEITDRVKTTNNKTSHSFSLLNSNSRMIGNKLNNSGDVLSLDGDLFSSDVEMLDEDKSHNSEAALRFRCSSGDSIPSPTGKCWSERDHIVNGSVDTHGKGIVINQNCIGKVLQGIPQAAKVVLQNKNTDSGSHLQHQPIKAAQTSMVSGIKTSSASATTLGQSSNAGFSQGKSNSSVTGILPSIQNLNQALQHWIAEGADFELNKFDEKLTQLLAWQRLQQLLTSKSNTGQLLNSAVLSHCETQTATTLSSSSSGKKGLLNTYLSQQNSTAEVRSRAVLCPLSGKGKAISMPYRTLSLGTGANMDVCLKEFGYCNFISGHHATIFYDEMSRHFELLNYSEHGTTVDNVLYSCDFSDKPATTPQPSPLVSSVRDINKQKGKGAKPLPVEKQEIEEDSDKLKMSAKAQEDLKACNCAVSSSSLIGGSGAGWEGTALLHHGSAVKVGCLQFVFSIVDQAPDIQYGRGLGRDTSQTSSTQTRSLPSSSISSSRFSSMPLISSSQFLHSQPSTSLLKTQLKFSQMS